MKNFLSVGIVICLSFGTSFAQQKNPLINSGEIIKQAIELHDSGAYRKAIDLYETIGRNDSNYVYALYEKALSCSADSQYKRAIGYLEEGLALKDDREREPEFYTQYASLIDADGNPERALNIFDSGMVKYPDYSYLPLNKATTLIELNRYDEAKVLLQKTLLTDPYCNSCHYMLGICALREGQIIPAFLSFTGYLTLAPDGRYSKKAINLLSALSKNTDEIQEYVDKRKEEPNDHYKAIEPILQSKIALDAKYKPIINLDDAISRQIQVIFEKLDFDEKDPDFWMQYYMPYFHKIFSSGQFEMFINHIFSDVNIKSIQDYLRKNKKDYQSFVTHAAEYFNLIRSTRELTYTKRKEDGLVYIYSDNQLVGSGNYVAASDKLNGPWKFFYSAGNLRSEGQYNDNGKKQGAWTFYYFNGNLKGKEIYNDGREEGAEVYYFDNGIISSQSNYKNDKVDGESRTYYLAGALKSIAHYQNGKLQGEKREFFSNGDLETIANYTADELDGPFKTFHQNGQLESTGVYANGKLEGIYQSFYDNGKTDTKGTYSKNLMSGTWNYYFDNGQLKKVINYNNGIAEGEYKEYYDNGQLFTTYTNNHKGKTTGEVKYFDDDGKLFSILQFDNDHLVSAKYLDKSGKEISSTQPKGKEFELVNYWPSGIKRRKISYNDKGEITGTVTDYHLSGTVAGTQDYKNGEMNGPGVNYSVGGKKSLEVEYGDGKKNGYYKSYYADGVLSGEGWYVMDKMEGTWYYYDEQGNPSSSTYYLDNEKNGYEVEYFPNGRKQTESQYEMGWVKAVSVFDTAGKVISKMVFDKFSGPLKLVDPLGRTAVQSRYVLGNFDGPYTGYFYDGTVATERYYKRGLADSIYRTFYYGGEKNTEGTFSLGDKSGTWKFYREGNTLWITEEYVNGKLNGHKIFYSANGGIDFDVTYKDDERNGYGKKYEPGGQLVYQIRYADNLPVGYSYMGKDGKMMPEIPIIGATGKVKTFYQNGNLAEEFEYVDGKTNGVDIIYFPNGKKMVESSEIYGTSEGTAKEFYSDGQVKSEYTYLHDNRNGPYKEYFANGKIREEGNYYNGLLHGRIKYYNENGGLRSDQEFYYGKLLSVKK